MSKTVAIDAGPLEGGHAIRGVGVYTRELTKALKALRDKEIEIESLDFGTKNLGKFAVIHYPYFNPYFITLPMTKPTHIVVTIHDLIPLIYPKQYSPGVKGKLRFQTQRLLVKNADAIISVSETSKKDIVRYLGIPADRIEVIYEAPSESFRKLEPGSDSLEKVKQKYDLPKKFVLYVGDVNYNKNVATLVRASTKAGLTLVIAGMHAKEVDEPGYGMARLNGPRDWLRFLTDKPHPEVAHYKELKELFLKEKVIRTGFINETELVALYNLATVYVQPSYYEGFGLPVLEAMACETPVVIARNNALVEIAGDAALVTDPKNIDNMAEKILDIVRGSSQNVKLIRAGKARVKEFSWKKCAGQTMEVYRKVITDGK
jgi:glycosyltransferase involved in cell wall biosynthesis